MTGQTARTSLFRLLMGCRYLILARCNIWVSLPQNIHFNFYAACSLLNVQCSLVFFGYSFMIRINSQQRIEEKLFVYFACFSYRTHRADKRAFCATAGINAIRQRYSPFCVLSTIQHHSMKTNLFASPCHSKLIYSMRFGE